MRLIYFSKKFVALIFILSLLIPVVLGKKFSTLYQMFTLFIWRDVHLTRTPLLVLNKPCCRHKGMRFQLSWIISDSVTLVMCPISRTEGEPEWAVLRRRAPAARAADPDRFDGPRRAGLAALAVRQHWFQPHHGLAAAHCCMDVKCYVRALLSSSFRDFILDSTLSNFNGYCDSDADICTLPVLFSQS